MRVLVFVVFSWLIQVCLLKKQDPSISARIFLKNVNGRSSPKIFVLARSVYIIEYSKDKGKKSSILWPLTHELLFIIIIAAAEEHMN